jgi:hypothetical protein
MGSILIPILHRIFFALDPQSTVLLGVSPLQRGKPTRYSLSSRCLNAEIKSAYRYGFFTNCLGSMPVL